MKRIVLTLVVFLLLLFDCSVKREFEVYVMTSSSTPLVSSTSSSSNETSASSTGFPSTTTSMSSTSTTSATTLTGCELPSDAFSDIPGFTSDLSSYPDPTANDAWPLDNLRSFILELGTGNSEMINNTTVIGVVTWVSSTSGFPSEWVIEDNTGGAIYIYGSPDISIYRGDRVEIAGSLYLQLYFDTPELELHNSIITFSSVNHSNVASHYIILTPTNKYDYLAQYSEHSIYANNIFLICGTYRGNFFISNGCSTDNPCYEIDIDGDDVMDIYVRFSAISGLSAGQYIRAVGLFVEHSNRQIIYGINGGSYPAYIGIN